MYFLLFRGFCHFYVYLAADLLQLFLYFGAYVRIYILFDFFVAYALFYYVVSVLGFAAAVFEYLSVVFGYASADYFICFAAADLVLRARL